MTDNAIERGKTMLATIRSANAMGLVGIYPDSSVEQVVGGLIDEIERLNHDAHQARLLRAIEGTQPPLHEDTTAMMLGLVPDTRADSQRCQYGDSESGQCLANRGHAGNHIPSWSYVTPDWSAVGCPACGQPPNSYCITPSRHEAKRPHLKRLRRALREAKYA